MEFIKQKGFFYFFVIFVFIIALFLRVFAIQKKDYFFHDDVFTFLSSTPNNLSPEGVKFKNKWNDIYFVTSKEYKGKDLKKSMFECKGDFKSIINDLKTMRNNNIERQHTNLYYSIVRLWNIGIDPLNNNDMKNRGCSLNLIFFSFSYFFMYKLLSLIKNDKKFILIGLFFAFVCAGTIGNTLLIREYALEETLYIALVYVSCLTAKSMIKNKTVNFKQIVFLAVAIGLFTLSDYFSLIFDFLLFLALIITCIVTKRFNCIKHILLAYLLAFAIVLLIYPSFFDLSLDNQHYETVRKNLCTVISAGVFSPNFNKISIMGKELFDSLFYSFINNVLLFLLVCALILSRTDKRNIILSNSGLDKKELGLIAAMLLLSLIWGSSIAYLCPSPAARFVMPIIPIVAIIYAVLLYPLRTVIFVFYAALYFILSIFSIYYCLPNIPKIEHLHKDYSEKNALSVRNDIPIIIVKPYSWYMPNYILESPNDTIIRFEDKYSSEYKPYHEYILVFRNYTKFNNLKYVDKCFSSYNITCIIKVD